MFNLPFLVFLVAFSFTYIRALRFSHPQQVVSHLLLCLRMVKHQSAMQPGQPSLRSAHQNSLKSRDRQLINAPISSKNSDLELFQNPKLHCYSKKLSPVMAQMKTSLCQPTNHTLTCSKTSIVTRMATSVESIMSISTSQEHQPVNKMTTMTNQPLPALLGHLSDNVHHQTMKEMSMQDEPASTSTHCRGMNLRMRTLTRQRSYPQHCRKPTLYSRISLRMSKEHVHPCSTVTDRSHSFLKQNGSACSAETQLTSTMSSQISTQSPITPTTLSSSERVLKYSMDHPHPQKLSRLMETGSLHGIAWLTPLSSCSNTESQSYSLTANTSSDSLHPYLPSSMDELSTMIGPSVSEQLNNETLNSPVSLSSQIYKFNGSVTRQPQDCHPTRLQNLPAKQKRGVEVPPVADGMRTGAPTQLLPAVTCMYVPNVPTQITLPTTVMPQVRNKYASPGLQWECRPRFVREYVWSDDESQSRSMALFNEVASPIPGPPRNELSDKEKWNVIRSHPHLFHIMTPIRVDHLHELLITHPNRDLVESVCRGLRIGFWPWATTLNLNAPSIVNNALHQQIRNPEHLQFVCDQRDEEIRLGRFSCAFSTLFPGMTTVPLWVIPKPHSNNLYLVVNHLAGDYAPNSFILPVFTWIHSTSSGKLYLQ
jgi:hypothetical protein